jgi:hypothetical protein
MAALVLCLRVVDVVLCSRAVPVAVLCLWQVPGVGVQSADWSLPGVRSSAISFSKSSMEENDR